MVPIDGMTKFSEDFLHQEIKYPLKERKAIQQAGEIIQNVTTRSVKTMETKYTFQMQRVFKMKLTLLSFKNPKL